MAYKKILPASFQITAIATLLLVLLLLALFIAIPNINDLHLADPAISSKTFFFNFLLPVIFLITISAYILNITTIQFHISKLDMALFFLLAYIIINRYFLHADQGFSLRFIELLALGLLYIIIRLCPVKILLVIIGAVILAVIMQSAYGFMQLFGLIKNFHDGVINGSFQNSGPFAGYVAIASCFTWGAYIYKKELLGTLASPSRISNVVSGLFDYFTVTGIAVTIIILPATHSRAAWLALIAGLIFLLFSKYKKVLLLKYKTFTGFRLINKSLIILSVILLFFTAIFKIYDFKKNSANGRLLIWKVTGNIIQDEPVFGLGFDRFKSSYMNAQAEYFSKARPAEDIEYADNTYYAFNEILQYTAENGIVGLTVLIAVIICCTKVQVQDRLRFLKNIAWAAILSIFVFSLFSYSMQILPVKMILVFALALLANLDAGKYRILINGNNDNRLIILLQFAAFCLCLIVSASIYLNTYHLKQAFRYWKQGLNLYDRELYQESLQSFEKAYPVLKDNGDYLMNYGKACEMAGKPRQAIHLLNQSRQYLNTTVTETALGDAYKSLKMFDEAEIAYQAALRMVPNRFYPEYLLAKLYNESNQKQKACKKAREILVKRIKIPSRAIEQMQREMKLFIKTGIMGDSQ